MNALFLLGRIVFGGFFVLSGFAHFQQLAMFSGAAASKGIPSPTAAVVVAGVLLLLGGLSIVLGLRPRLGALLLVAFLLPAAFIMHDFWNLADPGARALQMSMFLRNLAFAGGAIALAFVPAPWPYSLEESGRRRRVAYAGR